MLKAFLFLGGVSFLMGGFQIELSPEIGVLIFIFIINKHLCGNNYVAGCMAGPK